MSHSGLISSSYFIHWAVVSKWALFRPAHLIILQQPLSHMNDGSLAIGCWPAAQVIDLLIGSSKKPWPSGYFVHFACALIVSARSNSCRRPQRGGGEWRLHKIAVNQVATTTACEFTHHLTYITSCPSRNRKNRRYDHRATYHYPWQLERPRTTVELRTKQSKSQSNYPRDDTLFVC